LNYTLITGASKGIGKAVAFEAAARGMNLLLVARTEQLLKNLADEISAKHKVDVKILAADLLHDEADRVIFEFVAQNKLHLNMLVNNAGIGHMGSFDELELSQHINTMRLNMDACVKVAYGFLKNSDASQRRYILNIASVGAYQPLPKMSIYAATKSFMLFFSRAIRHELRKKNVYVTALCPGGTETEFFKPANMEEVVKKNAKFMMSAQVVAKAGLDGVLKNKSVVVPGLVNKLSAAVSKILPHDIVVPVAGNIYET
jgi:short-subunit dehydrogenase